MFSPLCLTIVLNKIVEKYLKLELFPTKNSPILTARLQQHLKTIIYTPSIKPITAYNEDTMDKINYITNTTTDVITKLLYFLTADNIKLKKKEYFPESEIKYNDFVNFVQLNTTLSTFFNMIVLNKHLIPITITYPDINEGFMDCYLSSATIERLSDGNVIINFLLAKATC